jgi:predicted phage terminase large subunit-like protein
LSAQHEISRDAILAELARRKLASENLERFAEYIDVPGRATTQAQEEGDWLFDPVESPLAHHHRVILRAVERTIKRTDGRLLMMAPPGAAKSSYTSVVAPAWFMGWKPRSKVIIASYASGIATKQSKRARSICRSEKYVNVFDTTLRTDAKAADEWALANGSELMSGGLLSGLTGNRADFGVVDDPVAGREEAESETMREKTWEAYWDDFRTRLLPGAPLVMMLTRWHQLDLGGRVIGEDWDGESGMITGTDGLQWEVLRIPARCDRADDPLGRKIGEYLWPQWFPKSHWIPVDPELGSRAAKTPSGKRSWASMYQQLPKPDDGVLFRREDLQWYDPGEEPEALQFFGASDWAVTERTLGNDPDFTEHGVWGGDVAGNVFLLAGWSGQEQTDVSIAAYIGLVRQFRPAIWTGEAGVIEKAIGPAVNRAMRENGRTAWTEREILPTIGDKVARVQAFKRLVEEKRVFFPNTPYGRRIAEQLFGFPGVRYDDGMDMCGLAGRVYEIVYDPFKPVSSKKKVEPVFGSHEWHDEEIRRERAAAAEQNRYFT